MDSQRIAEQSTFSPEEESLRNYRSVSKLAIVSLALGVCSAVALIHPVVWPVAWLAFAVSLMAIRVIEKPDSQLTGSWMAAVGLCLSVMFATWAPAKLLTKNAILDRQAQEVVKKFYGEVRDGNIESAYQWTMARRARIADLQRLKEFYETDFEAREARDRFLEGEAMQALVAVAEENAELDHVRRVSNVVASSSEMVTQLYKLQPATPTKESSAASSTSMFHITTMCPSGKTTDPQNWQIRDVQKIKP